MALQGGTVAEGEVVTQETLELAKRKLERHQGCATSPYGKCDECLTAAAVVELEAALRETREHVRHAHGCPASGGVTYTNFGPCQCGATGARARIDAVLPKPVCQMCNRPVSPVEKAAQALVEAMETCHICKCSLAIDDGPAHCEDCSGDCDDHDEPDCPTLYSLHRALIRALAAALEAAHD